LQLKGAGNTKTRNPKSLTFFLLPHPRQPPKPPAPSHYLLSQPEPPPPLLIRFFSSSRQLRAWLFGLHTSLPFSATSSFPLQPAQLFPPFPLIIVPAVPFQHKTFPLWQHRQRPASAPPHSSRPLHFSQPFVAASSSSAVLTSEPPAPTRQRRGTTLLHLLQLASCPPSPSGNARRPSSLQRQPPYGGAHRIQPLLTFLQPLTETP